MHATHSSDHAVTFLKFSVDAIDIIWRAGHAALQISFPKGLRFETNDMGGKLYRRVMTLRLPLVSAKVYLRVGTEDENRTWIEAAESFADAHLDIYSSPLGWQDKTRAQVEFVRTQDILTGRAQWMFHHIPPSDCQSCLHLSMASDLINRTYISQERSVFATALVIPP
jgi:hypothetical protein